MLIVRAPMRISFIGGGTDLSDFYHESPGRVISTAIDKYVYVTLNRPALIDEVSAKYSITEMVDNPALLKNDRIREALIDLGIKSNIEVATFTDVFVNAGLGSSSSFSVALMKGLQTALGNRIDKREAAEAACRLEIDLVGDPIGKQDQYAAAFGGFNVIQFNADESVDVQPVRLDFKKRHKLEQHILVFFTGITRFAAEVLKEQKEKSKLNIDTLKAMADSVMDFKELLLAGDVSAMGQMLHEGWLKKRTLGSTVTNPALDDMYEAAMQGGAWGGKVLGAGGGGCIMFIAPKDNHAAIRENLHKVASNHDLSKFKEIPVKFVQSGVEVLVNSDSSERQNMF